MRDFSLDKADGTYSAYSPDLPGCVATGATREETEERMHEAIELHIEGLKEDGFPVPLSRSSAVLCGGQVGEGTPLPTAAGTCNQPLRVKQSLNSRISSPFRRNSDPYRSPQTADPGASHTQHP
ncbi:type II toxin-antitoxin system HicB family antitoxin [Methanoculleus frigidifontis]|uniref:type II toxin-antitoxin system HicB family antitoxin n=1 Tax=Methanoculleus frigidifontis TaxID=2584085 RepID=UPI003F5BEB3F